jgi:hypothetical protein
MLSRKRHVRQSQACGRGFRILNIVDDVTREHLAHRAGPKVRVSEKWTRFSAPNDAPLKEVSIGREKWSPLFTSDAPAAIPDTSISGKRAARELTVLIEQRGKPGMIVSDHGTDLTSNAVLARCTEHRIE